MTIATDSSQTKTKSEVPMERRPGSSMALHRDRLSFFLDFENSLLCEFDSSQGIPTGTHRYEDPVWAAHVQRNVWPHHSDIDWFEYRLFCTLGYGDEWFQALPEAPASDAHFRMLEEWVLANRWGGGGPPDHSGAHMGPGRYKGAWGRAMGLAIDENRRDEPYAPDWYDYVTWVQGGGGNPTFLGCEPNRQRCIRA